jgi:hypothetical protein
MVITRGMPCGMHGRSPSPCPPKAWSARLAGSAPDIPRQWWLLPGAERFGLIPLDADPIGPLPLAGEIGVFAEVDDLGVGRRRK